MNDLMNIVERLARAWNDRDADATVIGSIVGELHRTICPTFAVGELRKFGPKKHGHPSLGESCAACPEPFAVGDATALVPLGPGNDPREQGRARDGRPYNAVAVEVHWSCATGETDG